MHTLVWLALLAAGALAGFWVASTLGWTRWATPHRQEPAPPPAPPTHRARPDDAPEPNRTSAVDDFVGELRARTTVTETPPDRRTTPRDQHDDITDEETPLKEVARVEVETSDGSNGPKDRSGLLHDLEEALRGIQSARRSASEQNDFNSGYPVEKKFDTHLKRIYERRPAKEERRFSYSR